MLTHRDVIVAATAALLTAATVLAAQSPGKAPLRSTAFDWEKMEVQKTPVGEKRQVFDAPVATLDRLECHITTVNPGEQPHPPHQHPEEELMLVKEGTLDVVQNGVRTQVGPGSVLFNASNEMHGFKNVGDKPATYFVVKWWSAGSGSTKPSGDGAAAAK
ncbi:MAG TPA: cupin domain-containing protein [Pirellulales bacterium]|jgi:mannose-6-phosphate isomerase-like protein (cupin superfamily)